MQFKTLVLTAAVISSFSANAMAANGCAGLPDQKALKAALTEARKQNNGGFNLDMWGTIVDRSGTVCAVAYSGDSVGAQWPGSRVISAQKANTANSFSLDGLAISTANLYSAVQPGGPLFGLRKAIPSIRMWRMMAMQQASVQENDPMVGKRIGGVNVFGGGLALYDANGKVVGGLGVSGDSSCADHNIGWRARNGLKLDYVPAGVAADKSDNIIYDVTNGKSAGGFGHVTCGGKENEIAKTLVKVSAIKKTDAAKK